MKTMRPPPTDRRYTTLAELIDARQGTRRGRRIQGFPCAHKIQRRMFKRDELIQLKDVHSH